MVLLLITICPFVCHFVASINRQTPKLQYINNCYKIEEYVTNGLPGNVYWKFKAVNPTTGNRYWMFDANNATTIVTVTHTIVTTTLNQSWLVLAGSSDFWIICRIAVHGQKRSNENCCPETFYNMISINSFHVFAYHPLYWCTGYSSSNFMLYDNWANNESQLLDL